MKKHFMMLLLLLPMTQLAYFHPASLTYSGPPEEGPAGPDVVNVNHTGVRIGTPKLSDPNWCYKWTADPEDPSLKTPDVAQPVVNPEQSTLYTLTLTYKDGSKTMAPDEVNVFDLSKIVFEKNNNQKYAYDDGDYIGPEAGKPWKLVAVGEEEPVDMYVYYSLMAKKFTHLKSGQPGIAEISPLIASEHSAELTIKGTGKGHTAIIAYCKEPEREVNRLNVVSYEWIRKSVGIRLVEELNDDVQDIPLNRGAPNQVAITTGPDAGLTTLPIGDDRRIFLGFWNITTGADGICETKALGDDFQKIPVGRGAPNMVCVTQGENKFMDTPAAKGDDKWTGEGIDTGPNGICETPANNTNIWRANYNAGTINAFINEVYNKVLVGWTVTMLPPISANADLNRDGRIEIKSLKEKEAIINASKADGRDENFNNIVLLVDNLYNENEKVTGVAPGGKHCFVDVKSHQGIKQKVEWTVAHELGHAAFGLTHPRYLCDHVNHTNITSYDRDTRNLMDYCNGTQLRKFQWDMIHK